ISIKHIILTTRVISWSGIWIEQLLLIVTRVAYIRFTCQVDLIGLIRIGIGFIDSGINGIRPGHPILEILCTVKYDKIIKPLFSVGIRILGVVSRSRVVYMFAVGHFKFIDELLSRIVVAPGLIFSQDIGDSSPTFIRPPHSRYVGDHLPIPD